MRTTLRIPNNDALDRYQKQLADRSFNYAEQGASRQAFPPGYDHDRNRILLGSGPDLFAKAKTLLQNWQHFPSRWTKIYTAQQPIVPDLEVVVLFRLFGLWWHNGARIVYAKEESSPLFSPRGDVRRAEGASPRGDVRRTEGAPLYYGFAYGTLQGHIERGEEIFYVSMEADGQVYYGIQAFSKPDWWPVKLAYPIARYFQRRFVRDSMEQMRIRLQGSGFRDQPSGA